jgi:muconolactone delta-isomerase
MHMKFLVVVTVKKDVDMDVLERLGAAEARAIWDAHKRGTMENILHRADVPGAVAFMQAPSREALDEELLKLPMHGHMQIEVIPLKPYDGLEALWAN